MKVWITRYALTLGLFELDVEVKGKYASGRSTKGYPIFTREWAKTRAEAVAMAEDMRRRRITSLQKSIQKLEATVF